MADRLQPASRCGQVFAALPVSEAAVGEDRGALDAGAGNIVFPARAVGAADGIQPTVDGHRRQIEAWLLQRAGRAPGPQATVREYGRIFDFGNVFIRIVHAPEHVDVTGGRRSGQGAPR